MRGISLAEMSTEDSTGSFNSWSAITSEFVSFCLHDVTLFIGHKLHYIQLVNVNSFEQCLRISIVGVIKLL